MEYLGASWRGLRSFFYETPGNCEVQVEMG